MINGDLRSKIDKLWTDFWSGGITNPLTVIEQISFLMFSRLLDIRESREEKKAARSSKPFKRIFKDDEQDLRWSNYRHLSGEDMLPHVRDRVFRHFRNVVVDGTSFGEFMKDAQLMILKPTLLVTAVNTINELPLTEGDTKGDLYEYLLGKLTTAGIAGQFRTPRHIIKRMVEMLAPRPDEVIGDPACGTAGFLVGTMLYLLEQYTSPGAVLQDPNTGEKTYTGDQLEPYREHIQSAMFHGFDFDATMLRIAAMNLLLHGIDTPRVHYCDTLSNSFPEKYLRESENYFDVILANPPFKGSLDYDDVHPSLLKKVKTKKTELLFITLILRMLKPGGRSATIVPDGVLFGSSKAHQAVRKLLVDENQLEGVISLPSGVFKPYAGVSTAILVFTKGGMTENVFYYDVQADGYSLDDRRDKIGEDDLPDLILSWEQRNSLTFLDRTQKAFIVSAEEIRNKNYELSLNRYKKIIYEEKMHDAPHVIIDKITILEKKILEDVEKLRRMVE